MSSSPIEGGARCPMTRITTAAPRPCKPILCRLPSSRFIVRHGSFAFETLQLSGGPSAGRQARVVYDWAVGTAPLVLRPGLGDVPARLVVGESRHAGRARTRRDPGPRSAGVATDPASRLPRDPEAAGAGDALPGASRARTNTGTADEAEHRTAHSRGLTSARRHVALPAARRLLSESAVPTNSASRDGRKSSRPALAP
jgi:hypothetical protein